MSDLRKTAYDAGYRDGESSGYADWFIALDLLNIDVPNDVTDSPSAFVAWMNAELTRLTAENEVLRAELEKANNEFGSQTADWPDLWRRIADLKEESRKRWLENEALRAALERIAAHGEVSCLAGNPEHWCATVAADALSARQGEGET